MTDPLKSAEHPRANPLALVALVTVLVVLGTLVASANALPIVPLSNNAAPTFLPSSGCSANNLSGNNVWILANVSVGPAPLTVGFCGFSGAPFLTTQWSFGDGSPNSTGTNDSSSSNSVTHTFTAVGAYDVSFTAAYPSNGNGSPTSSQSSVWIYATGGTPGTLGLNVTFSPTSGPAPLSVEVGIQLDGCRGLCSFQVAATLDNTTDRSSLQQYPGYPTETPITLAFPGTWTLLVNASDPLGDSATAQGHETVTGTIPSALNVTVGAYPNGGTAPLSVWLNSSVSNGLAPYTYLWKLGDGTDASTAALSHTYNTSGVYTAVLLVHDASGLNGSASVTIAVGAPPTNTSSVLSGDLSARPSQGPAPLDTTFGVRASGGVAPYAVTVCPGDGACATPLLNWSGANATFPFAYDQVGDFTAYATIVDASGNQTTDTIVIRVVSPPPPPGSPIPVGNAPVGIADDTSRGELFVANEFANTVSVVSDATDTVVATIAIPNATVGEQPWAVAYDPHTAQIFVTDLASDNVTVISDTNDTVVATIHVGSVPSGIAFDSATNQLFVTNAGSNTVSVISDATDAVVASVLVRSDPHGIADDPATGELFVANSGSDNLSVISDTSDTVVATVPVGNSPNSIAFDSATDQLFVTNAGSNTVSVVSDTTDAVVDVIAVGGEPQGIAYDPENDHLVVADRGSDSVSVLTDLNDTVVSTLPVGVEPAQVAYDPSTGELFVTNFGSDNVSVLGAPTTTPLTASLWASPTNGSAPLSVAFNGTASGGVPTYTYDWSFGDGSNGSGQWIDHTYASQGRYNVSLQVRDAAGDNAFAGDLITVGPPTTNTSRPLVVQLDAIPRQGNAPFNSSINVTASGGVAPYDLLVCPGNGACAAPLVGWTGAPVHFPFAYDQPGDFTATATVTDTAGNSTIGTIAINVTSGPKLSVTTLESLPYGTAPLAVGFLATVTGGTAPYSIQWAWGDGSFGSSTNGGIVAHAYQSLGRYDPVLTVRDSANGSLTVPLGTVNVTANPPGTNTSGGQTPGRSGGSVLIDDLGVAATVGIAAGIGIGLVVHQRHRARDASGLARSLESEAHRGGPPSFPPEGHP